MSFSRFLGLTLLAAVVGCGGISSESVDPPDVAPQEAIKTALQQMIDSQAPGSEIGTVMEQIEALKESDPTTAATLEADANELMAMMSANKPAALKAKAKEMLGKLEGSGG